MRGRVITAVLLTLTVVAALVLGLRGTDHGAAVDQVDLGSPTPGSSTSSSPQASAPSDPPGSVGTGVDPTSSAPAMPAITKLAKGDKPPQFVVISFDGACKAELWQHYLQLAEQTGAHFTFFLSGLCLVPDRQRFLYHPPHKPVGTSAIGFGRATLIPQRIRDMTTAYDAGHEIGTHFLGHFCDPQGVGTWSSADWASEINQARYFLDYWAEVNSSTDPSLKLPFSSKVWRGARTPCLAGKPSQMYPVWAKNGFTYDASRAGTLTWPKRIKGYKMWEFPLQRIKIVGYNKTNLSMDYNLLYVQNKGKQTAPPATCAKIQASTYQSYTQALNAVLAGNRAPLFIGNHFNDWACGAYTTALTRFITDAHAAHPDIQFVTFDYLTHWLDAQDPATLKALQSRPAPTY